MGKFLIVIVLIIIGTFTFLLFSVNQKTTRVSQKQEKGGEVKVNMKIASTTFDNNTEIPAKYTCDGENINPPFEFQDVPEQAKSLALIVDDPDAPAKTWVHWVIYNINPDVSEVEEDRVPEGGIEGMTDFGTTGYGGPCPPSGTHRYFFKLYALDSMLDLPKGATKQMVEEEMEGHIIEKTELIGLYSRN